MTPHIDPLTTTQPRTPRAAPLSEMMVQWRARARQLRSPGLLFWTLWASAFLPDLTALALIGWLIAAPPPRRTPAPERPLPASMTQLESRHRCQA